MTARNASSPGRPGLASFGGHSVEVLLRVYAKCLEGQDDIAKRRIAEALAAGN
jgi:hypothetical protein